MHEANWRRNFSLCLFILAAGIACCNSAHAETRLPVPRNDYCQWLADKLGDPYMERDSERCGFVGELNRPLGEKLWGEYCVWLADRVHKPQLATDTHACLQEGQKVSSAEVMNWNHPNRVTLRNLSEGLDVSKVMPRCEWLAKKHGDGILYSVGDSYTCTKFLKDQYARSPQESLAEYKQYCAYVAAAYPQLGGNDTTRFCPDVESDIRIKQSSSKSVKRINEDYSRRQKASYVTSILMLAGAAVLAYFLFVVLPKRLEAARQKARAVLYRERMEEALATAGRTREERAAMMTQSFDRRDATLSYVEDGSELTLDKDIFAEMSFEISRTITTMSPEEVTALRILYLLANEGLVDPQWFDWHRFALIYGDGKASVSHSNCKTSKKYNQPIHDFPTALNLYARRRGVTTTAAVSDILGFLRNLGQQRPNDAAVSKLRKLVMGGGQWLSEEELSRSIFNSDRDLEYNLLLGAWESGAGLHYKGEGSLITIAPPGSGKSQCHVIPNLLTWKGPALVLDVKGELYEKTRRWRETRVGPVYRFAPLDPERSACFNPLVFVRGDRFNVWEDSIFLADLFLVDTGEKDKFWSQRARDVLAAIIADTCYGVPPHERSMNRVHAIANRVGWSDFVADLSTNKDVASMREEGSTLEKTEEKTLDGVLQSLKVTLQPWAGERVRHVTSRSDWNPLDLRGPKKPTIYICLSPGQVDAFASVLRVFVGMRLRALTAELPDHGTPPILFMLDEMPRLRYMPPVVEALDTGRQYGIRLWMFAQSLGQVREVYKNADGMIGACAVQAYMNPSGHDGTAEHISKLIGERRGALDDKRQKLVEASELTGPEYKDDVIVFGANSPPARVKKVLAWDNLEFKRRMEVGRPEAVRL